MALLCSGWSFYGSCQKHSREEAIELTADPHLHSALIIPPLSMLNKEMLRSVRLSSFIKRDHLKMKKYLKLKILI